MKEKLLVNSLRDLKQNDIQKTRRGFNEKGKIRDKESSQKLKFYSNPHSVQSKQRRKDKGRQCRLYQEKKKKKEGEREKQDTLHHWEGEGNTGAHRKRGIKLNKQRRVEQPFIWKNKGHQSFVQIFSVFITSGLSPCIFRIYGIHMCRNNLT